MKLVSLTSAPRLTRTLPGSFVDGAVVRARHTKLGPLIMGTHCSFCKVAPCHCGRSTYIGTIPGAFMDS